MPIPQLFDAFVRYTYKGEPKSGIFPWASDQIAWASRMTFLLSLKFVAVGDNFVGQLRWPSELARRCDGSTTMRLEAHKHATTFCDLVLLGEDGPAIFEAGLLHKSWERATFTQPVGYLLRLGKAGLAPDEFGDAFESEQVPLLRAIPGIVSATAHMVMTDGPKQQETYEVVVLYEWDSQKAAIEAQSAESRNALHGLCKTWAKLSYPNMPQLIAEMDGGPRLHEVGRYDRTMPPPFEEAAAA